MMKKALTAAVAALTLGGAIATAATPAAAQHYRGGYGGYSHGYYGGHYYRGHDSAGPAIAAGVVGLALGAALASNSHSYAYDRPYYGGGYYDYDYGPRICETTRWVWDPYIGHRVPVHERYRC
jgi:opacity protein-like surface antigen